MKSPSPKLSGDDTIAPPKPEKKVIRVKLYSHEWPVYPLPCRGRTIFRVFNQVDGKRSPRTFMSLDQARAFAKSLLKERYGNAESKIHLSDDEKRDWQAAVNLKRNAGVKTSLESVVRLHCDLVNIAGSASLLTDVVRKWADSRGNTVTPITLSDLRIAYNDALQKKGRSKRYRDAQSSHTGQFVKHAGGEVMSDRVTCKLIQNFLDDKKGVEPRTTRNLLEAIMAMMSFGQSQKHVPKEWDEADQVIIPDVAPKPVVTYTPEELKKLLAAAPKNFRLILALAAFAGIRSSELESLDWKHIRLWEKDPENRIIKLDTDVTDLSSKRSIRIRDVLYDWLAGPYKKAGKVWTGTHDGFYRVQQEVAMKAGLVWKHNALRHMHISSAVAIKMDVGQVAYESGNSPAVIKANYLDLITPGQGKAWFAITRSVVGAYRRGEEAPAAGTS